MSDSIPPESTTVEPKGWYTSKTVWAALVAILVGLFGGALKARGYEVDQGALVEAILGIITFLAGGVALYGRVTASQPIKHIVKKAVAVDPSVGSDEPQKTKLVPTAKKVASNPNKKG